jgi:PTH2 family peptidyl-tRNA hydrolase
MEAKQVIVMRKDLGMRKGKMIAQGAHASLAALLGEMYVDDRVNHDPCKMWVLHASTLRDPLYKWLDGPFVKITVGVDSEDELFEIYQKALAWEGSYASSFRLKMPCSIIQDAGRTEFKGVPTYTCAAVGPGWVEDIDEITGHLTLL